MKETWAWGKDDLVMLLDIGLCNNTTLLAKFDPLSTVKRNVSELLVEIYSSEQLLI